MNWRDWDALRMARSRQWDFSSVYEDFTARKWRLIGPPLVALLLMAGLIVLQPPRYSADAQVLIGPRTAGLIGLRSNVAFFGVGQARLFASRDLARRVIKDLGIEGNPEFDPVTQSLGPVSRAFIFLGMLRDPVRQSPGDRVLEAYQEHLQVSAQGRGSLVRITFQSEDRVLAAKVANRIAELYLEMRAGASALPRNGEAHIVSRAITPAQPLYPTKALLLISSAALLVMAFGGFASMVSAGRRLPPRGEDPLEQPRVLGQLRVFARPRKPAKRIAPPDGDTLDRLEPKGWHESDKEATSKIMTRVLSAACGEPGARGARIVATSLGSTPADCSTLQDFARGLAREGRTIIIGLDQSGLFDFDKLAAGAAHVGDQGTDDGPGLSELLNGTASFAEVIRRVPASRLHVLRVGRGDELDLREFAHVLDALAETYDFLLIITPPLDRSGIAEALAASAHFAVLASPSGLQGSCVFEAEARLMDAGAREVLLIGLPVNSQRLGRDAA
ncbi:MAG TPA: hypothetical protein VLZ74_08165 [Methylocella sp.]|nr:hypothetical protein [Methylocella sp.]